MAGDGLTRPPLRTAVRRAAAAVLPVRSPDAGPDEAARRVVVGGWLLLAVIPFQYVARFGVDCPFLDEWRMVPVLVGERPLADWLTGPDSHRYFLPQAVWWGLHQLSGYDFRAPMFVSAWALAAAAWLLLRAVRAVRGHTRLTDLLVPAVVLHEAGHSVLLNGYDVAFALTVLLAAAAVAVVAGSPPRPTAGRLAGVGGLLLALAACGSGGQLLAAPPAVWLGWAAWRAVGGWRAGLLSAAALVPPIVLVVENAGHHHGAPPVSAVDPLAAGRLVSECLGGAVGPLGYGPFDPAAGHLWPLSAVAVAAVILAGAGGLLRVAVRSPADRGRAVGLLAGLAGGLGVLAALATKRSFLPAGSGFAARYCLFAALTLVTGYLGVVAAGWRANRWQTAAVLVVVAAVVIGSVRHAEEWGANYRHHLSRLWYRSQAGEPPQAMAEDACPIVCAPGATTPAAVAGMADGLEACRRHRIGPYRWLRKDRP